MWFSALFSAKCGYYAVMGILLIKFSLANDDTDIYNKGDMHKIAENKIVYLIHLIRIHFQIIWN